MNELGLTEDECMNAVMNNETAKHFIEKKTTSYIQAYTLIEAIIPCVLSLFIGPWTDENGRKWPIVSLKKVIDKSLPFNRIASHPPSWCAACP